MAVEGFLAADPPVTREFIMPTGGKDKAVDCLCVIRTLMEDMPYIECRAVIAYLHMWHEGREATTP